MGGTLIECAPSMVNPSADAPSCTPEAEAALVRHAQAGDLDAFNSLVEIHQRAVFNLCLRMIGNHASAEDGTQDAFLSAYRGIHTYQGPSFRAWLLRIAANAATDELRRRGRRPALSLDVPPPGSDEPIDVPDRTPGPETQTLRLEQQELVQTALLALPADQRLAVVLCDMQGFAYDEIAAATQVSIGTVKSRIARGREKLRAAWLHQEQMSVQDRQ